LFMVSQSLSTLVASISLSRMAFTRQLSPFRETASETKWRALPARRTSK
jgi:hypothetical protein